MTGGCPAIGQAPFLYGRRSFDKKGGECQNSFAIYDFWPSQPRQRNVSYPGFLL